MRSEVQATSGFANGATTRHDLPFMDTQSDRDLPFHGRSCYSLYVSERLKTRRLDTFQDTPLENGA